MIGINQKPKKTKQKSKGFTLIELIVAITIFLLVIGVAVIIFIYIIQHQRKILSEQELLNQISYIQEYMSKALRMAKTAVSDEEIACLEGNAGYVYLLKRPDPETDFYRGIKFINQSDNNACQEFFLDNSNPDRPVIKELKNSTNDSNAVDLTSEKLQIDFIRFCINGTDGSVDNSPNTTGVYAGASKEDDVQPRVTILFGVKIRGDSDEPIRIIQTTVSQRNLNVK